MEKLMDLISHAEEHFGTAPPQTITHSQFKVKCFL